MSPSPKKPKKKASASASGAKKRRLKKVRNEEKKKMARFMLNYTVKDKVEPSDDDDVSSSDDSENGISDNVNEKTTQNSTFDCNENEKHQIENIDGINIVREEECSEQNAVFSLSSDSNSNTYNQDPATWNNISDDVIEYFITNPPAQNTEILSETLKVIAGKNRFLTINNFYRVKQNGEKVLRTWLILSPSNKSLFCWICKLFTFASNVSKLSTSGFDDWKHVSNRLSEHENSIPHRDCLLKMAQRLNISQRIDSAIVTEYRNEVNYWRSVLKRVVASIQFLSSRGMPFFGEDETIGSTQNGNFLGCMELIAKFDPFISTHLERFGNPGKGNTSYLSSTTVDEFVEFMGKKVLNKIINEVKSTKYYSIIVDSTPDISHLDQLCFVLRYIDQDYNPVERFIKFIPIYGHNSEYLTDTVLSCLEDVKLDVNFCRGQSYDNASNLAGKYTGLQARIKEISPLAEFIPCAAHSLNLVGVHAVESCTSVLKFFSFLQELYTFFSNSTYRWQLLHNSLTHKMTLKSSSSTRWSANADATKALRNNYPEIVKTLLKLSNNCEQKASTRLEAASLHKKLLKIEILLNTVIWDTILERINQTSKSLQDSKGNISEFSSLFTSLINFVQFVRDNFDLYEKKALTIFSEPIPYEATRKIRTPRSRFLDDTDNPEVQLEPREKFIKMCHFVLCDKLISELSVRKVPYDNLSRKFSCILNLENNPSLHESAKSLQLEYASDLDADFPEELVQFSSFIEKGTKITDILPKLHNNPYLSAGFPNVETIVRIFLSMPISNCTGERSFSLLKRLKSPLRSYLQQNKLSWLALLCMNNDLTQELDYDDIIDTFANAKTRKKSLIC